MNLNSIRFTITSTTPNSRSAISSSTTACITAQGAPSRGCSKAPSMMPYEMKPPSGSLAFTSRRTSSTMRCKRWVGSGVARANRYMATGRPSEAAEVLSRLQNDKSLAGFVAYNLGIALLQAGRQKEAIEQLDKAGQLAGDDPASLAIRDKSNLVLGSLLFESGNFERAKQSLDRVRLEGPFSNQALLRAGWAEASAKQYDR